MKIPLSIKASYLPSWGSYEGFRELIQNGRDAEFEVNAPLEVRHRKDTDTLVIENAGAVLPHEALLLGHTTKVDRGDTIGKFGEGLKLGCLALVRAGHSVKIRSGSEVWVPKIERSEMFQADVLVFHIETGRKDSRRVSVEVGSITAEDWATMKDHFLFLCDLKGSHVETSQGTLLLDAKYQGKMYVKGIFVQNNPQLIYGYNLKDAQIDRDRKMIQSADSQFRILDIWKEALVTHTNMVEDTFSGLLDKQAADVEGLYPWNVQNIPVEQRQNLAARFLATHGEDAVPVGTLADSKDIEHLGRKGIIVPKSLKAVLESVMDSADVAKVKLREEVTKLYGWHELTVVEKANLEKVLTIVSKVSACSLDEVDIVDFRDPGLKGMFKDGRILLAKSQVQDLCEGLATFIHELAHKIGGGDGEHSHVGNMEKLWTGVVRGLL
jgi:hypothetical protein